MGECVDHLAQMNMFSASYFSLVEGDDELGIFLRSTVVSMVSFNSASCAALDTLVVQACSAKSRSFHAF